MNTGQVTHSTRAGGVGRAAARVPGSCGELAQGLIDGGHFLVSCPIDMYATASVHISEGSGRVFAPVHAPKASRAVALTLAHFRRSDVDASLRLYSPLPRGKGMASSTSDVSAAIAATATALGCRDEMPPEEIGRLALCIEPSDGLMLPGISIFDHKHGTVAETLGPPPRMRVAVLDFGGNVDTLEFNSVDRQDALQRLQPRFEEALALITRGIERGRAEDVAAGATLSAIANQEILFKPHLDVVLALADELGALGVTVAHSGTVIGVLFGDDAQLAENAALQIARRLPGVRQLYERRIVNGGVFPVEETEPWRP